MCSAAITRAAIRGRRVASALALAVLATACGAGTGATRSEPLAAPTVPAARSVTIWVDLPLVGAAAEDGRQMLDAVRLIVAQANAAAKVGALTVRVRASDDADPATGRSDPTRCQAAAARAATDPTAIAVVGTYESSCTLLALPALEAAGLALVSPVNSAPQLARPSPSGRHVLVRLAPPDASQGAAGAAELQALGRQRVFLLTGRASAARAQLAALVAAAPAHELAIAGRAATPTSANGIASLVRRVRASRADAVWLGAAPGPALVAAIRALVPVVRPARAGSPLALVGPDALYRDGLLRAVGSSGEQLHVVSGFVPPDALGGSGADFVDSFARQFGQPGLYTTYAADAARLVLAALRRSNGTRTGVLRALFRTRAYDGLIGTLGVTSSGGSTLGRLAVFGVHDDSFRFERVVDLTRS